MDALELPPDLGADRRMMNLAWPERILCGHAQEQPKCPGKRGLTTRDSSIAEGFRPLGKRSRCARWTSYRRWRLCLRSEAPKLFLPISALLLNGPYGRLPKPGIDHF